MGDLSLIDDYFVLLTQTAQQFIAERRTAMDIMQRDMRVSAVPELVNLRAQFLTQQDHERVGGLLASGCFGDMQNAERVAAFLVCFELDDEITNIDVAQRFRRYESEQPLFVRSPKLWHTVRDAELVPTTNARHLRRSGLVQVPGGWGRIDAFLPPELLRWAEKTFPSAPLFIRLDPWFATDERPTEGMQEAAVRPARPGWWSTLNLRHREKDGAHYALQAVAEASPDNVDEYYEYHVRGVRTLEVFARRNSDGNLSMMIEELQDDRSPDGRLIGRCVHLDSDAAAGADARSALMNHLDLAINVYLGEAAHRRQGMKLCDGKVQDASVRTHLLRIEKVPFASSAEFARQFFRSSVLFSEWIRDQFESGIEPFAKPD